MRYWITTDDLPRVVLGQRENLLDFGDFGTMVPVPGGIEAFGWIETDRALAPGTPGLLGLAAAERRGAS